MVPSLLKKELTAMREFLLPLWAAKKEKEDLGRTPIRDINESPDTDMCRLTSAFLVLFFSARGDSVVVCGGEPCHNDAGGYLKPNGEWAGHYWIDLDGQVVDLTAEQFGGEKIVMTSPGFLPYRQNIFNGELDDIMFHAENTAHDWFVAYMKHRNGNGAYYWQE